MTTINQRVIIGMHLLLSAFISYFAYDYFLVSITGQSS